MPTRASVRSQSRVTEVVDKGAGRGAIVTSERALFFGDDERPAALLSSRLFCRGDGGFGGPPGPSPIRGAGFLPCMLNREGQVYPVDANSAEGSQVTDYVRKGCEVADLTGTFRVTKTKTFAGLASVEMIRP